MPRVPRFTANSRSAKRPPLVGAHDEGAHQTVTGREGWMAGAGLAGSVADDVGDAGSRDRSVDRLDQRLMHRQLDVVAGAIHGPVPQRHERQIGGHRGGNLERRLTGG